MTFLKDKVKAKLNMIILVLLGLVVSYHSAYSLNDAGSVIFVNLIWRHGDRTPVFFYDSDPYKNEENWPEGIGELTNEGKRQHYELGKWLRQRYDSLLTEEFSVDRVYVQSTDVDRTIMSAQANLAGMFPPKGRQVWSNRLAWQPIPVHTTPEHMDKVLAAKYPCPAYTKEFERVLNSGDALRFKAQYKDVIDAVRENTGGKNVDFHYIHDLWNTFTIERSRGYTIPKWAEDLMPRLHEVAKYRYLTETWTIKLKRLKSGLLTKDMLENMKNRTEATNERVVRIYSAHDITLAALLNSWGVYDGQIPPTASCVMVELRQDKQTRQHYVMIWYRTSSTDEPRLLTLPGCTPSCPLDTFAALVQPLIPDDWDRECNESDSQQSDLKNIESL